MLLYWVAGLADRATVGQMHDDPIVFALKDPASYVIGVLTLRPLAGRLAIIIRPLK